ncbi:MAG: glycosyltransferase [Chitinivibrionales bacterium]|nr:glycosyltransferase [Chitinivibrionales bacterium]
MEQNAKRVLVAPLDWGLGHATRCIPVIRELKNRGCEVIIAAQGKPARLLAAEFPGITIVPIVNYSMSYAAHPWLLYLKFPLMLARVFRCAMTEQRQLDRIIRKHEIDIVISDNRFGCHNAKAHCIYISHQLTVLMPKGFRFLEPAFWWGHRQAITKYDKLWVPDIPGECNLTGDLTHKYPLPKNSGYIGLLSRFDRHSITQEPIENLDLLIVLSGPEPSRSQLEKKVFSQLEKFTGNAVVLTGTISSENPPELKPGVTVKPHASPDEILHLLLSAKAIICRGGYTTIMELVSLNKKAVLVPTPGQTEQLYLCERLQSMGYCLVQDQRSLDLERARSELGRISTPQTIIPPGDLLNTAIAQLFQGN